MVAPILGIAARGITRTAVGGTARGTVRSTVKGKIEDKLKDEAKGEGGSAGFSIKLDTNISKAMKAFEMELLKQGGPRIMRIAEEATGIIRYVIATRWLAKSTWKVSTGALMKSFRPTLLKNTGIGQPIREVQVGIFSNLVYAGIHEDGGTIEPRSAQHLAIPLTRSGRRTGPRLAGPLLAIISKKGNMLLMVKAGKGFKGKPRFLLRDSVTIKPKRYLKLSAKIINKKIPGQTVTDIQKSWNKVAARYQKPGGKKK